MRTPFRRHRGAEGAAAVEFALVMPILMTLVFGILQYGLWFNDSLNTRQGVREGARVGVVANFSETGCTSAVELDQLACKTANRIDALTGTAYVAVKAACPAAPTGCGSPPAPAWSRGHLLTVCAYVKTNTPGYLPMPSKGWIFSKTQMSIEKDDTPPAALTGTLGTLPAGPDVPTWPAECV